MNLLQAIGDLTGKTFNGIGEGADAFLRTSTAAFSTSMQVVGLMPAPENDGADQQQAGTRTLTIEEEFREAKSRFLAWKPMKPLSRKEQLYEYALGKQAIMGDVTGKRPPPWQREDRARWDAWAQLEGDYSKEQAMRRYLVETDRMVRTHGTRKK